VQSCLSSRVCARMAEKSLSMPAVPRRLDEIK
jgi:hypothetical protein